MPPAGRVLDEKIIARYAEGLSQADIARELGITRERVRQILKRNGIEGRNYTWIPEREVVATALRESVDFESALSLLSLSEKRFEQAIWKHDLNEELANARTRWKARVRELSLPELRVEQLSRIEASAMEVGHTPGMKELARFGVNHPNLKRLFGSPASAMKAAGLEPNSPGRPPRRLPTGWAPGTVPTDDIDELRIKARRLLERAVLPPLGPSPVGPPPTTTRKSKAFVRDPKVVAHALKRAAGICGLCQERGYEMDDGSRFLEVHHVRPLEEGGPDSLDNAAGVCETCHGRLHRDKGRVALRQALLLNIPGLVDHPAL